jgi:TatD DNase family protein
MLIDTHCHLDLRQFEADREAVIERASAAGVSVIVNPSIDLDSCRRVLAIAEAHEGVYAAVGVHPTECGSFDDETLAALADLSQHPKVLAIGEVGLDYYWERVSEEQQARALRAQLTLAAQRRLPVILHSRNGKGDAAGGCTYALLCEIAQWVSEIPSDLACDGILGIWHAFSGNEADADRAYELGLVLGLGGPVTFQNARGLQALVPKLRSDRLVLETDAPYLAPHPHRGQRNEPAYVPLIVESLARLTGIAAEAVAARTTATAQQCFNF